MFRPRDSYDQRLLDAELAVDPAPGEVRWVHDVFGNCVTIVDFGRAGRGAALREQHRARPHAAERARLRDRGRRPHLPLRLPPGGDGRPRAGDAPAVPRPRRSTAGCAASCAPSGTTDTGMLLMTLSYAINESFTYERRSEPGTQPPAVTLARPRHLPRLRAADDRGGALASASPPASSPATSTCRPRRPRIMPRRRARPMPGAGLPAGRRLGGVRPHQRHRRQPRPDPRRRRARPAARRCRSPAPSSAPRPTSPA